MKGDNSRRLMIKSLRSLFRSRNVYKVLTPDVPKLLITKDCLEAMQKCMRLEITKGHEGICYLLGRTTGNTTLVISVIRPDAETTEGSFHVESVSMVKVVRVASRFGLQVVGQVHTHPELAYHSKGDVDGARIAYTGYVSMVLPNYGRQLPSLIGSATYIFERDEFVQLDSSEVVTVPNHF